MSKSRPKKSQSCVPLKRLAKEVFSKGLSPFKSTRNKQSLVAFDCLVLQVLSIKINQLYDTV